MLVEVVGVRIMVVVELMVKFRVKFMMGFPVSFMLWWSVVHERQFLLLCSTREAVIVL